MHVEDCARFDSVYSVWERLPSKMGAEIVN